MTIQLNKHNDYNMGMSGSNKRISMGKAHVNHMPIRQLPCMGKHVGRSCLTWEDTQNLTNGSP